MTYELSPSLLAADFGKLAEELESIERAGCRYVHMDVMDGVFVPNITFGMAVIESLRKSSKLFFDVHLMIENPQRYIESFRKAGADGITIHAEAASHLRSELMQIKATGAKAAVAVKPGTAIEQIYDVLDLVDMILIMSVEPGFGGQKLIPHTLEKARMLSQIRGECGLNFDLEMDGGIYTDNLNEVLKSGINIIVAGSAIFNASDRHAAVDGFYQAFEDCMI